MLGQDIYIIYTVHYIIHIQKKNKNGWNPLKKIVKLMPIDAFFLRCSITNLQVPWLVEVWHFVQIVNRRMKIGMTV